MYVCIHISISIYIYTYMFVFSVPHFWKPLFEAGTQDRWVCGVTTLMRPIPKVDGVSPRFRQLVHGACSVAASDERLFHTPKPAHGRDVTVAQESGPRGALFIWICIVIITTIVYINAV